MTTANRLMKLGLAVSIIPAVLFWPSVAFLTVCPPSYGKLVMTILSVGFIGSWMAAIVLFIRARILHPSDGRMLVAVWLGITVSTLGLALTVYGVAK